MTYCSVLWCTVLYCSTLWCTVLAISLHGSFSDKCKILFQVIYQYTAWCYTAWCYTVLFPDYFSAHGGKNSLANCLVCFCPLWDDAMYLKKFYLYEASCKSWNYERALKETAHCRDHSFQSFQLQRNKDLETWNLCQPLSQRNPQTIILDIWSWKTSHCQLASSETHTAHLLKS